jgi:putative membrane protein
MPWMHVKLGFVFALYLYHGKCQQIFNQLQNDKIKTHYQFLRYGTNLPSFFFLFLVILKINPLIVLSCGILYSHLQSC